MGAGPITFNYSAWQAAYAPTFNNVSELFATNAFNAATGFCDNTACSPVCEAMTLTQLLYLLTCHIVWLTCPQANGLPNDAASTPPSPLVGRISDATEGSVTVRATLDGIPGNAAWYAQSQWGLMYWTLSAPYRMGRLVPGPPATPIGAWFGPLGRSGPGRFYGPY